MSNASRRWKNGLFRFLRDNGFVLAICLAVVLAWIVPGLGAEGGPLPVDALKGIGVFSVFFLQGLSLSFAELRRGASDWRLHLCVQGTTFVFFPVVVVAALFALPGLFHDGDIRAGFLYLSVLPSTIASALALTVAARGNASGALFNTTLSNGAGVFLVPFLCVALIGAGSGRAMAAGPVLLGIVLKIVLPLLLGQILRCFVAERVVRHKRGMRLFTSGVILFILFTAFADSFNRDVWAGVGGGELLSVVIGVLLLLGAANGFVWMLSGWAGLDRPSRVTAQMCGSQKTLAVGLPLAVLIFDVGGSGFELSVLLIPLLLYHPLQLVLGGWLAAHLVRFVERSE